MKYINEVEINFPRDRVLELLDNPDNMKHWQPGLISYEILSETPGSTGSKMKLRYKMGKREIEMIETMTNKDLPAQYDLTYQTRGVFNRVSNRFVTIPDQKTKWIAENEFKFSGIMMKIFAILMPFSFKKQSQLYLDKFKEFAETAGKPRNQK